MHLMILFGLSIPQLNFLTTLLPLNQKHLNQTSNVNEDSAQKPVLHKYGVFIKDFFSKWDEIRSFQRIWSHLLQKIPWKTSFLCNAELRDDRVRLKRVKLVHGWRTLLQITFLNQNGRIIFECRENVFTSYVICWDHIYRGKKCPSQESNIYRGASRLILVLH